MEETTVNSEDEISLIDLFAVLIRYRKFIVIFTLAVMVLAGVYLSRPILKSKLTSNTESESVQRLYTLSVKNVEAAVAKQGSGFKTAAATAKKYFQNVRLIANANKESPIIDIDESLASSASLYETAIRKAIKAKSVYVPEEKSDQPYEFYFSMNVKSGKEEEAEKFFQLLLDSVNAALADIYRPQLELGKTQIETALDKILSSESELASDAQKIERLKKLIEAEFITEEPVVEVVEVVEVAKKFIIVTFAAIFLSVFIAFALNAWANIKADQEAYGKLKAAWDAGK